MLNHVVLQGRLTRDPELRQTASGTDVASFTLAVDRDFTNSQSQQRDTDFIDIVAWKNTAIFVHRYFAKGQLAIVSGRLQIREWTDNNDNKRRFAEVVADHVYFGERKQSDSREPDNAPPIAPADLTEVEDDDGELPF